jgi:hypothetical protein
MGSSFLACIRASISVSMAREALDRRVEVEFVARTQGA